MANYYDFKNSHLGGFYDKDGWYSAQCWDGYAEYCTWLGVPYANCTDTGYASDIWTQRHYNGVLNYFDEVEVMQPGDVAVFPVTGSTPLTHIAIFDSDIDGTQGWFLGQNQGGASDGVGAAFNLAVLPYSATYPTAFRPKQFANSTPAPVPTPDVQRPDSRWVQEDGTFTSACAIYARLNGPDRNNESPFMFPAGSEIVYDAYCHANGYVWIRQPRSEGGYWYIPTGDSNGSVRTDVAWGSFQ